MSETELRYYAKINNLAFTNSMHSSELIKILEKNAKEEEEKKVKLEREKERRNMIHLQKEKEEDAHRSVRNTELRQQIKVNPKDLEYPFSYLKDEYYYQRTPKPIPGHDSADVGNFPHNIEHYYWIHEGANDEEPWMTLCRLTNGAYVFYKGECDYTGFDCQGNMELYSSMDQTVLITYGMSISDYDLYIKDTNPIV